MFLKNYKNTILIILFGSSILLQINYKSNKAEAQRANNLIKDSLDRSQKTMLILKSNESLINHIDDASKNINLQK